ncbi:MAG: RusA family crossover junction endodeoxyribonuclease [Pseudomonadota bacterium]
MATGAVTGFIGRGPVQAAFKGKAALVRIDIATTQTRQLKTLLNEFLRREARRITPSYAPFDVRIWTSVLASKRGAHDVDNIAKACLDALSGVFWRDDRQVVRLSSERFVGQKNQIAIMLQPLDAPLDPVPMDETLFEKL